MMATGFNSQWYFNPRPRDAKQFEEAFRQAWTNARNRSDSFTPDSPSPSYALWRQNKEILLLKDCGPWPLYPTLKSQFARVVAALEELDLIKRRQLYAYDETGKLYRADLSPDRRISLKSVGVREAERLLESLKGNAV